MSGQTGRPPPVRGVLGVGNIFYRRRGNMSANKNERAVVVTTKDRGVFFGYIAGETCRGRMKLRQGRNCVRWPVECRGFIGLAAEGPLPGSRVGPAADIELFGITSVLDCTAAAVKLWESEPWD